MQPVLGQFGGTAIEYRGTVWHQTMQKYMYVTLVDFGGYNSSCYQAGNQIYRGYGKMRFRGQGTMEKDQSSTYLNFQMLPGGGCTILKPGQE